MRRLGRVLKLDIEEIFGDVDEVLQVECPAEDHFQWQCGHPEQQLCEDHEAEVAHSLVEGLEPFHGEERWECDEVETDHDEAGEFSAGSSRPCSRLGRSSGTRACRVRTSRGRRVRRA